MQILYHKRHINGNRVMLREYNNITASSQAEYSKLSPFSCQKQDMHRFAQYSRLAIGCLFCYDYKGKISKLWLLAGIDTYR